jgi:hypothetical protein
MTRLIMTTAPKALIAFILRSLFVRMYCTAYPVYAPSHGLGKVKGQYFRLWHFSDIADLADDVRSLGA